MTMKKPNFWTRVRNVFTPDQTNGLSQKEIDALQKLKDKEDFKDVLFEPLQLYAVMVKKYGNTDVALWVAELMNNEISEGLEDETFRDIYEFICLCSKQSKKHELGQAQMLFDMLMPEWRTEAWKNAQKINALWNTFDAPLPYVSSDLSKTKEEVVVQEKIEPPTEAVTEVVKPKSKRVKEVVQYSYNHPLCKGKTYATKLFQDVWEILPDSFTRQSAYQFMQKHGVGSYAFLNTLIVNGVQDGILLKPRAGYYEKNVARNIKEQEQVETQEPSIEIEEPETYKIVEEKIKQPIRKLDVVNYHREKGNVIYVPEDWITVDAAQIEFGLNKKYIINLVNYYQLKTVGKVLLNGRWTCVVNYGELQDYCEYKEKVAERDGHQKDCQSCQKSFNAWNNNVNICRTCMSGA